jgi:predicted small metal-binding protein
MAKVINCECGYSARGDTDEELLSDVRGHIQAEHPDMDGVSDEQILAMAEEA